MNSRSKSESDRLIRSSGVNYSPFVVVNSYEEAVAKIDSIPEPLGLREKKSAGGGLFLFGLTKSEFLKILRTKKGVSYPVGIYFDTAEAEQRLIYQGEFQLFPDGGLLATYSSVKGIKNREACADPKNFTTVDLRMDAIKHRTPEFGWDYQPLQFAIKYLCKHNLIGPVVELSHYGIGVGWKNEPIVIWEIRNY